MKKYLVAGMALLALEAGAQKTPVKKAPVKSSSPAFMKSLNDSASYAIGLSVAKFYASQGITNLNAAMISRACSDVFNKKPTALNEDQANTVVMRLMSPNTFKNIDKGDKFLASNKKKAGVKTTASGLQYEVIREGTGPKPSFMDTVEVNYAGALLDGTEFDNSYKRGAPLTFPVGGVIKGWTEALQLMSVGSKYKLYIPYQLAYGMNDNGPIPGGSVLVFDVELLSIKGK